MPWADRTKSTDTWSKRTEKTGEDIGWGSATWGTSFWGYDNKFNWRDRTQSTDNWSKR